MGMIVIALLIWVAGGAATAYAAFLLVLSKIALAIILGIGPIFVLLIMFEPTKRFFDVWIGQALSYVFLVILTAASIKLMLAILQKYLVAFSDSGVLADPAISQAFPAIILSLISFLVMMQLPSIASALGGGTAIGTLGAVGWTYGKTKGGMTAMRPTELRRSYNKAAADVRLAAGAARATAGLPASVYRKITGSTVNRIAK
jgi:type IV secretion system protein VirB6